MTTFSYPNIEPSVQEWSLKNFTAIHESPFNGEIATQDRDGEHWLLRMAYNDLEGERRHELLAFLYKLNGPQHRFTIKDFSYVRLGAGGGSPLVQGAGQTGKNLIIDNASISVTDWLKAGDKISVAGLLHSVDEDVNTSGTGVATIIVSPRIFVAPTNNEAVEITTPINTFLLASSILPVATSKTTSSVNFEARSSL